MGKDVQTKHLDSFMVKMKHSGYTARYRKQIVDSTYKAWDILLKVFESGEKPLYRGKIGKNKKERN